MSGKPTRLIVIVAATLALAGCQQSKNSEQAPAPAPIPAQPAPAAAPSADNTAAPTSAPEPQAAPVGPAMTPKPAAPAPKPPAPAPQPPAPAPKPPAVAPAPPAPAPKPVAPAPKPAAAAVPAESFNTAKCQACHSVEHDKVGPAWKTVVEKYGDAATLARDFESGFKERRVANSIAKWKPKESLMTSQFNSLIKGHEKAAAHALFETVKNGKFGNY